MSTLVLSIFIVLLFGNLFGVIYWATYLEDHTCCFNYTIQGILCDKCKDNNINIWGKILVCILITPFSVMQLIVLIFLILGLFIGAFIKKVFFKLFQNKE